MFQGDGSSRGMSVLGDGCSRGMGVPDTDSRNLLDPTFKIIGVCFSCFCLVG